MRTARFVLLVLVATAGVSSTLARQTSSPQPDVNRDGIVNGADLTIVRNNLGRRCGQSNFDSRADVDGNCIINGADLAVVARRLNTIVNQAPVARITDPATAFVGQPVILDGRASSDPEGSTLTYRWELTSRPTGSVASVAAPTTALTSFVPDRPGSYQVLLVVSDGTLTGQASVTVTTTNRPPVAVAGTSQTTRVGETITFDGTGSSDPDGDALLYAWSIVERPLSSTSALSNTAAARPTLVIDAGGTYVLRLVVTDTAGLTSTPSEVRVSTTNSPPTANAGRDQTVARNTTVRLTGAGSSDPDGDPLFYQWEFVTRPSGSAAALVPSQEVETSFVADRDGDFLIRLTVIDSSGESATDTVAVNTVNSVPIANAGEDQSVAVGAQVTLDASSSTDVDGDPLTYAWSFASRPDGSAAALSDAGAVQPTFIVDVAGTYVLQLSVSDGIGGSSDTVVISTLNSRPIADAGPDQLVTVGGVVTLDGGSSRDADGDPLTYAWALTTVPEGSQAQLSDPTSTQPFFTVDKAGTYVAQLIVNDGQLSSIADTVSVSTTNVAPVAHAGGDPSRLAVDSMVTLDGTASSDADSHTLSYFWSILVRPAGSSAVLDEPTSAMPSFTVDAGGDFVVQLIVSDGFTSSQPDTVVVRGNMIPVADAGTDTTSPVGVSVPLTGAASSDADGDPLSHSWTLLPPVGSQAFLSNATTAAPTFVPDIGGSYVVSLVVHDGYNASAPDTVTVTVEAPRDLAMTPAVSSVLTFDRATLTVSSETPAPAGGLLMTLNSSDDTLALPPPDVTIPAGETSATFDVVTFANAGNATITATIPGTQGATATVAVALRSLSLSLDAPVVGVSKLLGGTITLANPPPAGGAAITLTPGGADILAASPGTVSVPDGATTAPLLVVGLAAGNTALTASAAGFAPAIVPVGVRYSLALAPNPVTLDRTSGANVILLLSAPAPSGGATVGLSTDAPTTASVPASVVIPAGATSTSVVVNGLAEGTTTLRATLNNADPASVDVTVTSPLPAQIDSSPANGDGDVAVTRETIFRLSRPLAADAEINSQNLFAEFGGLILPTRVHISSDRKTITLFYLQTLPASARVRVHFDTDDLRDALGVQFDGDQNGQPGGTKIIDFDTLTLTTLEGTALVGRVFASQLGDGGVNTPLADVIITVDGLETTLRTTTDAMGNFRIEPAPAGAFFVHIDGRSATNDIPIGSYYPVVGKKWVAKAGEETNIGDVFLPLIAPGTLQPVSETQDTTITFPASVLAQHPHLAGVNLIVPADSLYTDGGARGGMVGIAPVPPDRIPSPLPPGLNLALVITVQTDGATNFDRPVPVCFPNLPNPATGQALEAGDKSALWSFNHDTGDWEVVGPMTVSSNATLVCSDPGAGILQPGWHGQTPGTQIGIDLKGFLPDISPECRDGAVSSLFDLSGWIKDIARLSFPAAAGVVGGFSGAPAGPAGAVAGFNSLFSMAEGIVNKGELVVEAGKEALQAVFQDLARGQVDEIWKDVDEAVRPVFRQNILANLNPYLSYAEGVRKTIADSEKLGKSLGKMLVHCFGFGPQPPPPPPPPPPVVDTNAAYDSLVNEYGWAPPTADEYAMFADLVNSVPELIVGGPPMSEMVQLARAGADVAEQLSEENLSPTPEEIAELTEALEEFTNRAEFMIDHPEQFAQAIAEREQEITALVNKLMTPVRQPIQYTLSYGDTVIRGSSTTGHIDAILPANAIVSVTILNPGTLQTGGAAVVTGEPGSVRTSLPASYFDSASPDTDGDGLTDTAEAVLGTNPQDVDTDGDGVTDGAEVQQGTNPLDGLPARTGIIATADTPGIARDVAVKNDLAVVADEFGGITVFNIASGATPVAIAQVDTFGEAQSVAFEDTLVAVADGFSGLSIVDISDPPAARVIHQLSASSLAGDVKVVAVAGGLAYAGVGFSHLVTVDMASGTVLNTISGLNDVDDLAVANDELYVLTREQLRIYRMAGANLELLSTLTVFGSASPLETGRKLFVGGGLAYIGHFTGYVAIDVSAPSVPRIVGTPDGVQLAMHDIAANGSGLVLGGTSFGGLTTFAVSLFDGSDPTNTSQFITSFPTPGDSRALWIYNGLAYIADQAAGLQVLNYLPYDADGVPPTLTLTSNFALDSAGGLAEENARMRLTANVADDVQVRSVDFYVDGQRVARDGSFPFEHRFVTPLLADRSSFSVRACAFDTGGNSACTEEIVVTLTEDATRPRVVGVSPDNGSAATEVAQLTVDFSEDLDSATVDGALTLTGAGEDQQFGTGDDLFIAGTTTYLSAERRAVLTFAESLPAGLFRGEVAASVTDLAGNTMADPLAWIFITSRLTRISIVATDGQASEAGPDSGSITITRTGDTTAGLLIDLTVGGTAQNFVDHEGIIGSLFIQPGEASVTVPVMPVLDALVESDETVVVTLVPTDRYVIAPPDAATVTISDSGLTLSIAATDASASEATLDPGAFTITRTGPTGIGFNVNLLRGGTATNLFDYQNIGLSVFFPSGQSSLVIPVTPIQDALLENTETVTLTLAPGGYIIGTPSAATVEIADSGTTVTIAATDPAASEAGPDAGTFTVTRTGPTVVALPVNLTRSGTATPFTDYSNFATSVTIPQGQSSATVTVTPVLDALLEDPETVVLTLAAGEYLIGTPDSATVTIADSGTTVSVAATDGSASESGGDPGVFTVTRTGPTGVALPVNFTFGGSATVVTDYANIATSVTIPSGQASATVTITPVIDGLLEGNETVTLTLAAGGYTVGAPSVAAVTIADHLPVVTLAAADPSATEGADPGSFVVTREGPTGFNLTVSFTRAGSATNGTDYTDIGTSVLIPAGQPSATVTVNALVDFVLDPGETVELSLATGAYTPGTPSSATVTITDAPPPINVSVFTLDGTASESGTDTGTFQIFRSGETTFPLTVNFTMSGTAIEGVDYTALGGSVVIPAGQGNAIVTVSPIADGVTDGTETATLTLAPGLYTIQQFASSASLNINDGPPPSTLSVIADDANAYEGGPDNGTFMISRTGSVVSSLTVNFTLTGTATNGTDYQTIGGTATIPVGQTFVRVTVTPIADALAEVSETVILTLAPGGYVVSPTQGTATMTLFDGPAPSVVSIVSQPAAYEIGPGTAPFVVIRNGGALDVPLTVNLTIGGNAANGVDYEPIPASVVIPPGQTQVAIHVIPRLDAIIEVQENVIASIAPGGYLISQIVNTATIAIFDTAAPTVVQVLVADPTAFENGRDPAAFQIERTGPSDTNVTVNFTLTGPAVNGIDYDLIPLSVVIPAGRAMARVNIVPITDTAVEFQESVVITLTGGTGYQVGTAGSAGVNISDFTVPTAVLISAYDASGAETGPNRAVFLVSRTGPTTNPLTVNIGRAGTATVGIDYVDPGFNVVIPAGESTATIAITPIADAAAEGSETVIVSVIAGTGYSVAVPSSATATIFDAAPPPVLAQVFIQTPDSVAYEGNHDAGTFYIQRLAPYDSEVTVNLSISGTAVNGVDYETIPTTVVIPAGQLLVPVTVVPRTDALTEARESVIITLAPGDYAGLSSVTIGTMTIVDAVSDVENFVYIGATDATGSEVGADSATFIVGRTGSLESDLIVTLVRSGTAAPGSDYGDFSTSVVIPAGQSFTTLSVIPVADGITEPTETVTLTITPGPYTIMPVTGTASVMIADFGW